MDPNAIGRAGLREYAEAGEDSNSGNQSSGVGLPTLFFFLALLRLHHLVCSFGHSWPFEF